MDLPPGRIGSFRIDSGQGQRSTVGPHRVPADATQNYGKVLAHHTGQSF
jgi:hypothetical protein